MSLTVLALVVVALQFLKARSNLLFCTLGNVCLVIPVFLSHLLHPGHPGLKPWIHCRTVEVHELCVFHIARGHVEGLF